MAELKPEIIAKIRLYSKGESTRKLAIPPVQFSCPLGYKGKYFDCRLLLDQLGEPFELGSCKEVPIKFLCPDEIVPRLKSGECFSLWERGTIGEGEVVKIFNTKI